MAKTAHADEEKPTYTVEIRVWRNDTDGARMPYGEPTMMPDTFEDGDEAVEFATCIAEGRIE